MSREPITIESIQRLTPAQRKELNDQLAHRVLMHFAVLLGIKIAIAIFVRRAAKRNWT